MSRKKLDRLVTLLQGMRIVPQEQLDGCLRDMSGTDQTPDALLQILASRHLITPWQKDRLEDGDASVIVLGDYKLMYRSNSGSFARVFRASSLKTGEMVALKLLREKWAQDPEMVTQFKREAAMVKRLKHKNIVPIFDIGTQADHHYFTMEFIQGGNLKEFLEVRKKLSAVEATRYTLDIAEGLEYALTQGVTHRDLKLSNVLMSTLGVARLVDFGLGGDDGISGWAKGDGQQRALEYATLEKGTGAPINDARSDLFFLGGIYYELLTGQPPYSRTRDREARKQLSRYQNIKPIRMVDPKVHRPVDRVVSKMIELNPHDRQQSPSEVVSDLREVLRYLGENTDTDIPIPGAQNSATQRSKPEILDERPSVLCVEHRVKQQNVLREHLGNAGYRVLMISDLARAEQRMERNPPDCLLINASAFDAEAVEVYRRAAEVGQASRLATVIILSQKQEAWRKHLEETDYAAVISLPLKLPVLCKTLSRVIKHQASK